MTKRYRGWLLAYVIGLLALLIVLHLERPWMLAGATAYAGEGTGPRAVRVHVVLGDGPSEGQGQQLEVFYRTAGDWRWRKREVRVNPDAHDLRYQMDEDRLRVDYRQGDGSRNHQILFFP